MNARESQVLKRCDFDALIHALQARGFTVVGPTVEDGAIVYEELADAGALPAGWTERAATTAWNGARTRPSSAMPWDRIPGGSFFIRRR